MNKTETSEIVKSEPQSIMKGELTREQVELLKATICKGASDGEFQLFVAVCNRTGLDPFARQIHAVMRKTWNNDRQEWQERMVIQVGIDGLRLISQRSHEYEGPTAPQWCGKDGKWVDVWLQDEPPAAARVAVYRRGFKEPCYGIARYKAYVQMKKVGKTGETKPNEMWQRMDAEQLAKCAEALAHRRGFPNETSGIFIKEEIEPEDNPPTAGKVAVFDEDGNKSQKRIVDVKALESAPSSESSPAPSPVPAAPAENKEDPPKTIDPEELKLVKNI